jgi:hypothetical protein
MVSRANNLPKNLSDPKREFIRLFDVIRRDNKPI